MVNQLNQSSEAVASAQLIQWGKDVLYAEAQALHRAADRLDQAFARAVSLLSSCRGTVVITGLGKSGHVGTKIAATLASTGTRALFVHASEALHGDFGMVSPEDCLVAIAFGGETREVLAVVNFVKAHKQGTIAITGNVSSSLAKLCDIVLDGSVACEADPLNLAPTTSSTVALALGDALAVALMHERQFTREHFYALHPGGKLGRSLARVTEWMHPLAGLSQVNTRDNFHTVLQAVSTPNFGICPVLGSDRQLAGVITDGDVRRALLHHGAKALEFSAEQLMNKNPKTIAPEVRANEALMVMEHYKITAIFVQCATTHALVGLLRLHDLVEGKLL